MTGPTQWTDEEKAILARMRPEIRRHFMESYEENKEALRALAKM